MILKLMRRPGMAGLAVFLSISAVGAVLAAVGLVSGGAVDATPASAACNLYPIAVPAPVLAPHVPGDRIVQMPRSAGSGQYGWLTWASDPSAAALARSLTPPGNSKLFTEPGDPTDHHVDAGDWIEGAPGAMNSAQVRSGMTGLVGTDIVVPVYDATRGRGANFDYRVARFATIRLRDFNLTGQGWLTFDFVGYRSCNANTAPQATAQSLSTREDTALPIQLAGSDAENDPLTYEVLAPPQHGTLSGQAPALTYAPARDYNGTDRFTFRVNDGVSYSAAANVDIAVSAVDDAPVITSTPITTATEGVRYAYQVVASDVDAGDAVTFSLTQAPAGMVIDPATGLIEWVPTADQVGMQTVTLAVTDGAGVRTAQTFVVTVARANHPPRIVSSPVLTGMDGQAYVYAVVAQDSDPGDALSYALDTAPAGMAIDAATGAIAWIPSAAQIGSQTVVVRVSDRAGSSDVQSYVIVVVRSNRAPTIISTPTTEAMVDQAYVYQVVAHDPDIGDTLTYSLAQAPSTMRIDAQSGEMTWTPGSSDIGTVTVVVRATDHAGATAEQSFSIVVARANHAPTIVSMPVVQMVEDIAYRYQVAANDPDLGDTLTYSLRTAPTGMRIDAATGVIDWSGEGWIGNSRLPNAMCLANSGMPGGKPLAADLIAVVDESGSMTEEQDWVTELAAPLEAHMLSNDIGTSTVPNRFGLIGYATMPRDALLAGQQMGNYRDFIDAANTLRATSDTAEEGWRAIRRAATAYPLRDGVDHNLLLVTDEDRDNLDTSLTYDGMLADLRGKGIALHAVIPVRFMCGDGTAALGMASNGIGYREDGRGGYVACTGTTATEYDPSVTAIPDYMKLAMASGGTAWDIGMLSRGGVTAQSFTNALIHLMVRNIDDRAPQTAQADAYVDGIRAFGGIVIVDVGNRGLVPLPAGGRIDVFADDRMLGSTLLQPLAPGALQTASVVGPMSADLPTADPSRLTARIVLPNAMAECNVDNNTLDAAWVRVRATDTGGLFDEQAFAVVPVDRNNAPTLAPISDATVSVGRHFGQTVQASDPDRGDALRFALSGAPLGMRIDLISGRIDWTPDAQQIGTHTVQISATDLAGATATRTFNVRVDAALPPPHFDSTPQRRAIQGTQYRYQSSAVAESSAVLRYDVVVGPAGMAMDPVSGLVSWAIPADYAGHSDPVVLRVRDQYGNYDLQIFTLLGDLPNQPPQVSSVPLLQTTVGDNYGYLATAQDVNVLENFHWRIDHGPAGASIGVENGQLSWAPNAASSSHPAALTGVNPYCLTLADHLPSFASQRVWNASNVTFPMQTLVGPLFDSNLDGELSESDLTAVVAISWNDAQSFSSRIHAFDARNGRVLWSFGQRAADASVAPAMADLDGTGEATVLFVDTQRYLVALRADGTQRWMSAAPVASTSLAQSAVVVSDLDGDGHAEILVGPSVYSSRGVLKWQFGASTQSHPGIPAAIDLDGDGHREVLYRGEIRDASGTLRARTQSTRDTTLNHAFYAPIRIAGQPGRHVAVSESTYAGNRLSVIDAKGNALWVKNGLAASGPVLVADVDGDGNDDIYVPSLNSLYSAQGDLRWTTPLANGAPSDFRTATVTDLDRDGELDLLVYNRNASALNLIAGRTGAVIGSLRGLNIPSEAVAPTVVDVEGTGDATLFVGHSTGLSAYRSANTPWHSLARVWHQGPFALDQIGGDMRLITADPTHTTAASNVVGVRQTVTVPTQYQPDLRVSAPYGRERSGGFEISVDVNNRGTGGSSPSEVVLYRGSDTGAEIGRIPVPALAPGQSVNLKLQTTRVALGDEEVTAMVSPTNGVQECELGNNIASGRVMQITVSDYGALEGAQSWLLAVNARAAAPVFASTAPGTVIEGQTWRYQPVVTSANIGDAVSFALVNAPDGARVDTRTGEVVWSPRWGQTGNGFMFTMEATSLSGAIATQIWYVNVTPSTVANQLPSIVSTPVTAATVNQVYRYDVRATDPDGQAITYSLATAPTGMRIDPISGIVLWQPISAPSAPVDVKVIATDERQGRAEQSFQIRVYSTPNHAPVIVSTPTQSIAPGQHWVYTVHATDADGDALTTVWNRVPAGATTVDASADWTPPQSGEYIFDLEVRDTRGGVAHQAFTVFVNDPTQNAAPRIVSTPNPRAAVASAYASPVQAVDDDGDRLTYALTTHPKGMTIDAATGVITWTPAADQIGDHVVGVQVSDGRGGVVWQTWTVRVGEIGSGVNRAPLIASAAPLSAKPGVAYRYDIAASDPDGDLLAYSLIDAPNGMTLDAQRGRIDWTPTAAGSFAVRVRVSDGLLWTEQSWTLTVADGVLSVTIDPVTALLSPGEPHTIRILPKNAASQVQVALTLDGVLMPVDADLSATLSTTTLGRHALVAVISDGVDTARAEAEFFVLDGNSSDGPVLSLTSPADGATITAPTAVTGSVADLDLAGWKLSAVEIGSGNGRELAAGTGAISGTLGTFDPTLLQNGQYALVLQAWDTAGHQTRVANTVVVEGEMKLGHFSMTFEDASIPVMGIPITITRTYDSRRSGQSLDFGHGWTVDAQNVRLQESRLLGLGWSLRNEGGGLFPNWCVRPAGNPLVSVVLPDGKVEKFKAKASPECSFLVPASEVELTFEPQPGTTSQLAQNDFGSLRINGGNLVDANADGAPVDPDHYTLTLLDGTRYDLDQAFGLRKVSDLNGNSLTYTREGVLHSTGVGVRFVRDAAGRIVRMQLPDNTELRYDYDANGDLVSMTDQVNQSVRFNYLQGRYAHYLQDIVDPRGVRAARNEYDANGRLVAHIDADGHRIEYTTNLTARTQTVKNRLGQSTTYLFDERGNVLQETNALGETTRHSYDALGNELSQTNGENETTRWSYDAAGNKLDETNHLGQITRWAYDNRGQIVSQTDASGNVTVSNTYNARSGDLLNTTDGAGGRTDLVYDLNGNLIEMHQPLGATTTFGYDSRGNKVYARTPQGVETQTTFDANGRVLSESRTQRMADGSVRTLTTTHVYDDKGREIATTDALGNTTRSEYNAIDKVSATIDAQGRRTTMVYDNRGNLIETHHPDGTVESTLYDEENHVIASTDRAGRTTLTVYDAAGRVIATQAPDGAIERSTFDHAGRQIAQTDARGNVSSFEYDDAGRLIRTTNPFGYVTTTTYNPNGTKASVRDAYGQSTKFVYDGAGRAIETLFADGTPQDDSDAPRSSTSYDAQGRKIATIDEVGRTSRFEYNTAGQLIAVIDPLNQRTSYTYDAQGNKIGQTDALGRTTRWEYDEHNREIARILPLGQRETKTYDAFGRLLRQTDFTGAWTQYGYDIDDRVNEVRRSDGSVTTTTYTASGQVETQTDAAGTTRYAYDSRDRLLSVTHADGVRIDYTYDAAGNRTSMSTSQQTTTYGYDAMNRLYTVTQNGNTTTYSYDPLGNRSSVVLPNGTRTTYVYDERSRLKTLTDYNSSGQFLLQQTYTLDASGLRTRIVETSTTSSAGTRTLVYSYDALKRLTREQVTDASHGDRTSAWTYDAVGNRLSETKTKAGTTTTTTSTYDDNDRLQAEASSDGTTTTYRYDANGSLIEKHDQAGTSVYSYDAARRLVDAITPNAGMTYRYDANGIRQSQTVNGITTRFVVDPTAQYAQVLEERSASGNVLYLLGDERIARAKGGRTSYLHADGLGSTRAMTDENGRETAKWWYEAFGEVEASSGGSDNAFLFAGEQLDPNLGYYYLRARYMDPSNGRFTQMDDYLGRVSDPISLHRYIYANASPQRYTDPSGYMSTFELSATSRGSDALGSISLTSLVKVVTKVAAALLFAYGTEAIVNAHVIANERAKEKAREELRTLVVAEVVRRSGRDVLYYYSRQERVLSMFAEQGKECGEVYSGRLGNLKTYPAGLYATDVTPWDPFVTRRMLAMLFYGGNVNKDTSWFAAIDGSEFYQLYGGERQWVRQCVAGEFVSLDVYYVGPSLLDP